MSKTQPILERISSCFRGVWRFIIFVLTCQCVPEDIRSCKDVKPEPPRQEVEVSVLHQQPINVLKVEEDSSTVDCIYNGSSSGYGTSYKYNNYIEPIDLKDIGTSENNYSEIEETEYSNLSTKEDAYCTCDDIYDEPATLRYENEEIFKTMQRKEEQETNNTVTNIHHYPEGNEDDDFDEGVEEINNHVFVTDCSKEDYRRGDIGEGHQLRIDESVYGIYKEKLGTHASSFKNVCKEMKGLKTNSQEWKPSQIRRTTSQVRY